MVFICSGLAFGAHFDHGRSIHRPGAGTNIHPHGTKQLHRLSVYIMLSNPYPPLKIARPSIGRISGQSNRGQE